jgi:hypothetical protein
MNFSDLFTLFQLMAVIIMCWLGAGVLVAWAFYLVRKSGPPDEDEDS